MTRDEITMVSADKSISVVAGAMDEAERDTSRKAGLAERKVKAEERLPAFHAKITAWDNRTQNADGTFTDKRTGKPVTMPGKDDFKEAREDLGAVSAYAEENIKNKSLPEEAQKKNKEILDTSKRSIQALDEKEQELFGSKSQSRGQGQQKQQDALSMFLGMLFGLLSGEMPDFASLGKAKGGEASPERPSTSSATITPEMLSSLGKNLDSVINSMGLKPVADLVKGGGATVLPNIPDLGLGEERGR
jgi:hypothetical protein